MTEFTQIKIFPSKRYYHVGKIDLGNNGTLIECAIVKQDNLGNVYFIRLDHLDDVDLRRIHKIVTGRNAPKSTLYDLMHENVLGNGINALHYFHQLVRVITPTGQIMKPSRGNVGVSRQLLNDGPTPDSARSVPEPEPTPAPKKPAGRKASASKS